MRRAGDDLEVVDRAETRRVEKRLYVVGLHHHRAALAISPCAEGFDFHAGWWRPLLRTVPAPALPTRVKAESNGGLGSFGAIVGALHRTGVRS